MHRREGAVKTTLEKISTKRVSLKGEWTTLTSVAGQGGRDVIRPRLALGQVEAQLKNRDGGLHVELSFVHLQKASPTSRTNTVRTSVALKPSSTPGYYVGDLDRKRGSIVVDVQEGAIVSAILNLNNNTEFSGTDVRSI